MKRVVGAAVAVSLLGGVAAAQPAPADAPMEEAPKDPRERAKQHYRLGEKAYRMQSFEAAAEQFELAYKTLALPEIAFSAAQAYRRQYYVEPRLELAQRAVELYRTYLDKVKQGGRVRDAADSLGDMQRQVAIQLAAGARARALVAEKRTTLTVNPELATRAGARDDAMREVTDAPMADAAMAVTVRVDGKDVKPYDKVEVTPGTHRIEVEAAGYVTVVRMVPVGQGDQRVVDVPLAPKPARVAVTTEAGAAIKVDGREVGVAPLPPVELPEGRHVLSIARPGRVVVLREVMVTRGQELALREPLEKTGRRKAVPWVAGAAGGLAVLAGVCATIAFVEDGNASELQDAFGGPGDRTPADGDDYERAIRRRDSFATGAYVAGGAAVLAGGVALALYAFDRPSEEGVKLRPAVGKGTAGLWVGGSF